MACLQCTLTRYNNQYRSMGPSYSSFGGADAERALTTPQCGSERFRAIPNLDYSGACNEMKDYSHTLERSSGIVQTTSKAWQMAGGKDWFTIVPAFSLRHQAWQLTTHKRSMAYLPIVRLVLCRKSLPDKANTDFWIGKTTWYGETTVQATLRLSRCRSSVCDMRANGTALPGSSKLESRIECCL